MKLEISYNGSVRDILSAGQTAIIPKEMEFKTDIVIRAVDVNLISFTIGGTTYQAEEGMTWEGWCVSDYCPEKTYWWGASKAFMCEYGYVRTGAAPEEQVYYNYVNVTPNETIIANAKYTIEQVMAGGN